MMIRRSLPLLVLLAVPAGAQQRGSTLTALLDSVVPAAMRAEAIPGAVVAVVQDGRVIASRGYGVADLETNRPMTDTTIVRVGSISKVMTAVAVAQLADRGRIRLDTSVNEYLRSLRVPSRFGAPITAWHLLTHTAALDEIRPGTQAERAEDLQPLATFLAPRLARYAPPGIATAYSTYGSTLAGLLVEDVSGLTFEQYLVEQVWRPLGMHRTSIAISPADRPLVAVPYDVQNGRPVRAPWEWYHTTPASSVNSTAADMAKFMLSQLGRGSAVLSERMTREMQREQITVHPRLPGWGLGWQQLERPDGERGVQHGGDVAGFSALVTLLPRRGIGVFVAGHREGADLRFTVTRAVLDLLAPAHAAGTRPALPHNPDSVVTTLAQYAGHYRANIVCHTCPAPRPVAEIDVSVNRDGTLSAFGGRFVEESPRFFRSLDGQRRFGFRADSLGRISHLSLGAWQVFERVPLVGTAVDSARIRATVLDYVDGWYEGNAERMERAVHPDLAKRIWRPDPERGANRLDHQGAMLLVQNTRRGWGRTTPEAERRREIEILEIFGNAATVRARMSQWVDLMHLARIGGEWKIVNVLWELSEPEIGERGAAAARSQAVVPSGRNPGLRAEIQAVNDSLVAAFQQGDMKRVAAFYTDDARIDGERGTLVIGRKAIDDYWLGIRNGKSWKLEVLAVGGHPDNPWQVGRSTLVTAGPNGERTSVVEFLAVWRRQPEGGLRLELDYYRW